MRKSAKKALSILIAMAIAFTCAPSLVGGIEAEATATPAQVKTIEARAGSDYVKLSWSKIKKNIDGYVIYKNDKYFKNITRSSAAFKKASYSDNKVKPSTKYEYYVKAYKIVKKKQWYNKKTGKWQTKKPEKKYRGKTRTAPLKQYGKTSPTIVITTTEKAEIEEDGTDVPEITIKLKSSKNQVTVSWDAYAGAEKFRVYRGEKLIKTLSKDAVKYVDKNLKWGAEYEYKLEALENGRVTVSATSSVKTAEKPVEKTKKKTSDSQT